MRTYDFAPLYRTAVGFDRMMDLLQHTLEMDPGENYPPYNIEKTDEDAYRITMAVAGFGPEDLTVTAESNTLTVAGRKSGGETARYLHQGIGARAFEKRFDLADFIKVMGASLENGVLSIDLVREVPEEMKPRQIKIEAGGRGAKPTIATAKVA